MDLFERAIAFASEMHSGDKRKVDSAPYILHPIEVALIVSSMTYDEEVLAAAVLHDTVEDTEATLEQIEELFGERTAKLVAAETEDKRPDTSKAESWRTRKEESLEVLKNADDIGVKYIWLGDKLSNLRGIRRCYMEQGDDIFQRFNQKEPSQHAWYYRSIRALLGELAEFAAFKELSVMIDDVFGKEVSDEVRHER